MLIPSLVLLVASAVIVVGAVAQLIEAVRLRRVAVAAGSVPVRDRLLAEMDPAGLIKWMGLAALAVMAPVLIAHLRQPASDVALVVVVLGFAAERADYLARRFAAAESRPAWRAAIAVLTVAAGVVVALSL